MRRTVDADAERSTKHTAEIMNHQNQNKNEKKEKEKNSLWEKRNEYYLLITKTWKLD